jgi:hypothetical protein
VLDVRVTWPNSGKLEFGCIRDAWLACAACVVAKLGQLVGPALSSAHCIALSTPPALPPTPRSPTSVQGLPSELVVGPSRIPGIKRLHRVFLVMLVDLVFKC